MRLGRNPLSAVPEGSCELYACRLAVSTALILLRKRRIFKYPFAAKHGPCRLANTGEKFARVFAARRSAYTAQMTDSIANQTRQLADRLVAAGLSIATAESCTGGLIAKTLTDLAGSSAWFECGFVTYSNQAKIDQLGVQERTLLQHGAVSEATALEMAAGAVRNSRAQVAVAVTGIAGPGGGSAEKPVGTVWFGFAVPGEVSAEMKLFSGDRAAVRTQSLEFALHHLNRLIKK